MSRQLALGGQPVLVARWSEAPAVALEQAHLNRLLLVDAPCDAELLAPLVRAALERGCALMVCLGPQAEQVQRLVARLCDGLSPPGQVATSWHDPSGDSEAALEAFSLFTEWVGGAPGIPLLVTEDAGLDAILDAARTRHARSSGHGP
jgi:hypothetical protein